MRSPRDLRTVASLPDAEFVSTGDQVPQGIGNAMCQNGGNPMPSIYCTDFPRTFVSYGDLGQHIQSWSEKALSQPAAGWLMSPMEIRQKDKDSSYWSGQYQRLTVEGSVIVRHHEPRRGIDKNGLRYEKMVPMTLLCDPDAATLEKWFQPLPGEE